MENIKYNLPEQKYKLDENTRQNIELKAKKLNAAVVSLGTVKDVKKQVSSAKKLANGANKKRIEITKKLKNDVDDALKPITDAIDNVNGQVKQIEENEKEDKKQRIIKNIILPICASRHVDPNDVGIDKKWLNKTTSKKVIEDNVAALADKSAAVQKRKYAKLTNAGVIDSRTGEKLDYPVRQTTITFFSDDANLRKQFNELINNTNVINVFNQGE